MELLFETYGWKIRKVTHLWYPRILWISDYNTTKRLTKTQSKYIRMLTFETNNLL